MADSPQQMAQIGASLTRTLYAQSTDVFLMGDVGSGKTTFMQGVGRALGVDIPLQSPTFTLEQRYATHHGELLHMDLYRLAEEQAVELLRQSEGQAYLRCIEMPQGRSLPSSRHPIVIAIEDTGPSTRILRVSFDDVPIPSSAIIDGWRTTFALPDHVIAHCECVASVAQSLGTSLLQAGTLVRMELLDAATKTHDLFRFLDFKASGHFPAPTELEEQAWQPLQERFAGLSHEEAAAQFLREEGYAEVARIVETHGVVRPPGTDATVEQLLAYYADKRCMGDVPVSIDDRFADFRRRYGENANGESWLQQAKDIERRLFADSAPALRASS